MCYYMIMDVKKKLDQRGQALVEFMLFLPFMLMLYATISSIGNALNGSINQQKIARAYFYYRAQNNSTLPKPKSTFPEWKLYGMVINGWMQSFADGSEVPLATCYKFNLPLGDTTDDECEEGYTANTTQYIRVGTVYGICGATYSVEDGQTIRLPDSTDGLRASASNLFKVSHTQGCVIE